MGVRTLRITVLKSAGSFTRGECHDLSAEKIQRVKCFMFTGGEFVAGRQFSNASAAGRVRKFQPWSIGGSGGLPSEPRAFSVPIESERGSRFLI
jgi:hypothetical protein